MCVVDRGTNLTPDTATVTRRFVWGDGPIEDSEPYGHGTSIAQLIAAPRNGWGIVGIAPQLGVVSIGIGPENESGWTAITRGVWACGQEPTARVVSISSAPPPDNTAAADQLAGQVTRTRDRGISVIVSAGNTGGPPVGIAALPGVIPVAALTPGGGALCGFSSRAPGILATQGCQVQAPLRAGAAGLVEGTSFAAPQAAAALAALRAYRPDLDRQAAEDLLLATARPGPDGTRIVDATALFGAAGLGHLLREPPATVSAHVSAPRIVRLSSRPRALRVRITGVPRGARVVWRGAGVRREGALTLRITRGARARQVRIASRAGTVTSPWRTVRIPAEGTR